MKAAPAAPEVETMRIVTSWLHRLAVLAVLIPLCASPGMAGEPLEELSNTAVTLSQEGKWKEAAEAYARLAEAQPEVAQHWVGLARAYRNLEEYDKAVSTYEKALSLDATSALGMMGLAITLELQGEVERAFEYLAASARQGIPRGVYEQDPAFAGLREHPQFAQILEVAQRAASPCLHDDPYDDFDFWVGDWDIHLAGKKQAENVITKEMNGCIIRESYHDNFGSRGESLNYYDPQTKKWKQNWVDAGGGIVYYSGGLTEEGVMHMEGTNTRADGTTRLARVTWTRLEDGKVHHVIEHSTDQGETWTIAFDGTYIKSDRTANTGG